MTLTPESLADVMEHRLPNEGYESLFPTMNEAMIRAECTTVERAAGWMSQLGEESGGLRWFTELGQNCVKYEGRDDLGNTQPGDGCRFKGRGPIQVTGRAHYTNLSKWAFERGFVPTPTFFVDDPAQLASVDHGFIGAVWYWNTHKRPDDQDGIRKLCNQYCDEGDIVGLTKCVNGGTHGLDVRQRIWNHALAMGDALMPAQGLAPPPKPNLLPRPDWQGDPTFLPGLLRSFGLDVYEYPGWDNRGHGDFGAIWGVVWHHTGNVNETDEGIAHHPVLGLAANMLIHPDGKVVLTGVGVAWHAGKGIYPGLPEDAANQFTIGIECAYGPDRNNQFTLPWPTAQVETMITVGTALQWFLGYPTDHNIAHKEWAGADNPLGINKQGKPDPANFDMNWFRAQIDARVKGAGKFPVSGDPVLEMLSMPSNQEKLDFLFNQARKPWQSMYREKADDTTGNAFGWDERVESSALRLEPWAVALVVKAAKGQLAGVLKPDGTPDKFLVDHAKAVLVEVKARYDSRKVS